VSDLHFDDSGIRRLRVLFVEDEDEIRELSAALLEAKGYEVVGASDGEDALQKLRSEPAFDALVTDVVMPRMNGICLLQIINEQHPELSSRAIVLSGVIDSAASLPPHFVLLRKPCDTDDLVDALQACVARQGVRR